MTKALNRIEIFLSKATGKKTTHLVAEEECKEYSGFNFSLDQLSMKFRKAKITPKKVGLFVTLWKRGPNNQTEPFSIHDNFDFYIIATEQDSNFGFFLFPKIVLSKKKILACSQDEGKRGFRVYPGWADTENKQAKKTQSWQTEYFIDLTKSDEELIDDIQFILSNDPVKI